MVDVCRVQTSDGIRGQKARVRVGATRDEVQRDYMNASGTGEKERKRWEVVAEAGLRGFSGDRPVVVKCSALKHHAVRKQSLGALGARDPPGWVGGIHFCSLLIVALPEAFAPLHNCTCSVPALLVLVTASSALRASDPGDYTTDEARSSQPSAANLIWARFVATPAAHIS